MEMERIKCQGINVMPAATSKTPPRTTSRTRAPEVLAQKTPESTPTETPSTDERIKAVLVLSQNRKEIVSETWYDAAFVETPEDSMQTRFRKKFKKKLIRLVTLEKASEAVTTDDAGERKPYIKKFQLRDGSKSVGFDALARISPPSSTKPCIVLLTDSDNISDGQRRRIANPIIKAIDDGDPQSVLDAAVQNANQNKRQMAKIDRIQDQVQEVAMILGEAIDKAIDNDDKLMSTLERAEQLESQTYNFKRSTQNLKETQTTCWAIPWQGFKNKCQNLSRWFSNKRRR